MAEQKLFTLKINDRETQVAPGTLVIEAARRLGIEVPSFCYYPGLTLQAACRMCLVEVEKTPKMQTACTLTASDGMIVRTDTPQVHAARKGMLEFLLTNHPLDCPVCDKGGECELQDMVFRYGAETSRFVEEKYHQPEEKWSEAVYYDAPRCILCFRCVRVCDEGMGVKALGVGQRGVHSVIIPNREDHLECEECGMCIDICPVGALTSGTYRYKTRPWEMTYAPTTCAHCSNGCKVTLSVRNNEILRANNRDLSGINGDFLCAKGRFGFDFTRHPERLRLPLVRRNGKLQPATWEEAIGEVAARLAEIHKKNGGSAIGFIGSNRTTNEENYLLQRIARAAFGTNNVDHHRTADYAGLVSALGANAAAASATMQQLGDARAIFLIGNDATNQNPLVAWQIRAAIRHYGARLYILNAQSCALDRKAKITVVAPGGETGAVRWLATGEGSAPGELAALKEALAKESYVFILFGASVAGAAVRDLVKYGSSLSGQTRYMALGDYSNSRGAADMGLLPSRLPGYSLVSDTTARARFAKLWGAELSAGAGMSATEMLAAAQTGNLKALYVVGANPVKTFGVKNGERPAGLEFLVVHELFMTETARLADVVLPAASSYEKDGSITNTAGEVQLHKRAMDPVGARTDFDLLRILSHQLAKHGLGKPVSMRSPDAVFEEIRANVAGYDVALHDLLTGAAAMSAPRIAVDGTAPPAPAGAIFSSGDTLFTSGSLGRYFTMIPTLAEAKAEP
ncbi:MAG TPA: NADH-quinone oxidoreductase subunit NuoG [Candidatus Acidoferrales bacterium]|jgi:NADH-quinone oxidoreductase subunit G|nr:NADH-quinone oxidoreductase subunit NuoG [Candidatus Acidoferrales bacterium]